MKASLRLVTMLAVTLPGAISAQAGGYSVAGANAYVQSRDYQGLLKYSTAWSKAEPNNADAWSYLGVVYGIYLKQPDKAVGPMLQSLKLNPNQAPGWHALGITYIQLKQNADAVSAISHAIKLNPNQPTYYNNLAAAYAEMARWQDAFNTLNDELPLAEKLNNATIWYTLGNGYARLEQAGPAVSAYQHAIKLSPNQAQLWTNLGTMLQWGGNVQVPKMLTHRAHGWAIRSPRRITRACTRPWQHRPQPRREAPTTTTLIGSLISRPSSNSRIDFTTKARSASTIISLSYGRYQTLGGGVSMPSDIARCFPLICASR
jgi:tetratricopeptide (TPR) repeat protein